MTRPSRGSGFTLVELMMSIAILSILLAVAVPKFADSVLHAKEGNAKGQLAAIRGALSLYYGDNNGLPPNCAAVEPNSNVLTNALVPRYLDAIPKVDNALHPATNNVYCDANMVDGSDHDGTGWYYDGLQPSDSGAGSVWIACDHESMTGQSWTTY